MSLDKPFANGLACKFPQVTINASDIQALAQKMSIKTVLFTPQELKILKSKVDVEAEQNASSFTSTVNTTIFNGHLTTFLDQVKVEKKKTSVKAEVQAAPGGTGKQQATRAHPLMSSASLGAMPQRCQHSYFYPFNLINYLTG